IPVLRMKVVGAFAQTYVASMIFTFIYLYSLALLLHRYKPLLSATFALLSLFLLLGTQSRMGVVAAFFTTNILFILFIFFGFKGRKLVSVIYFGVAFLVILSLPFLIQYAEDNYPYLYSGIVNYI